MFFLHPIVWWLAFAEGDLDFPIVQSTWGFGWETSHQGDTGWTDEPLKYWVVATSHFQDVHFTFRCFAIGTSLMFQRNMDDYTWLILPSCHSYIVCQPNMHRTVKTETRAHKMWWFCGKGDTVDRCPAFCSEHQASNGNHFLPPMSDKLRRSQNWITSRHDHSHEIST